MLKNEFIKFKLGPSLAGCRTFQLPNMIKMFAKKFCYETTNVVSKDNHAMLYINYNEKPINKIIH